jgi:hypothetical protein
MRRLGTSIFLGTIFVVAFGCNAVLDNEPGRLDRGASAGQGGAPSASGGGNGAAPISGSDPDGSGNEGSSGNTSGGTGGNAGAPDPSAGCSAGQKACGGLCVAADDPFFGCASPVCARCEVANATAACVAGACGVGACAPGFADCNALAADGCEANLQTPDNCGGCGLACPAVDHAAVACVGGVCSATCAAGFGNCNGKAEDGCEKNLLKDKNNCGACGARCAFGRCEEGVCVW